MALQHAPISQASILHHAPVPVRLAILVAQSSAETWHPIIRMRAAKKRTKVFTTAGFGRFRDSGSIANNRLRDAHYAN
jgi:hypothetical protein